jgi:hypothetical protein
MSYQIHVGWFLIFPAGGVWINLQELHFLPYTCWAHFDFSSRPCVRLYLLLLTPTSKCLPVSPMYHLPLSHGNSRRTVLPSASNYLVARTLRRNSVIKYYAIDAVRRYREKYPNRRVPDVLYPFCWQPITRDGKISRSAMGCSPAVF